MLKRVNNERGITFILVVWVVVLLIAIGTQFAYSMRTEVNTTRNYKEDTQAYYLAKAGINLAMAEILKKAHYHSWTEEKGFIAGTPPAAPNGQEVPEEDTVEEEMVREDLALGAGTITYGIRDENGRININSATRTTLVKVLEQAGMDSGSDRDAIADSILDWIDKDDNHRLNGAENDYYKSQFPPYKAKNGPMDTLDELMMVKGVTKEMFYGSPEFVEGEEGDEGVHPGLNHFFTVQAVPFFNPNTASPEVLKVVYPEANVAEILSNKEGQGYHSLTLSSHFRIRAVGKINNSQTEHTIEAVIEKSGNDDKSMLIVRFWKDNQLG